MNIAVFEAKSKLSALLDKACSGEEEVVIPRHGAPIARVVPMNASTAAPDRARAVRAVRAVRALNKRLNIDAGVALSKLIDTGRD